jgi:GDSL-like Lipase/Acylhydrolase family
VTRLRSLAVGAVALSILVVIGTGLAEAMLRVWYRDNGRTTLGGPGGRQFDYETIDGELRGRRDVGPRVPGVPRLMIVGDSITYGVGVHRWRDTWPELLAHELERKGQHYEMAVFAFPGQDILQHVNVMREWDARVSPDVFIYQWYVNDIEAMSHRPDLTHAWQRWRWHDSLRDWSYLYFVLDHRLAQMLPPPTRSYVDYLLADFAPGTMEWAEFERQFHEFATRAALVSARRIMALYPQVPFRGQYPLQTLNDRMRALAAAHDLEIPPAAWIRSGGTLVSAAAAPWKQMFTAPAGSAGAIETPEYVFAAGPWTVTLVAQKGSGEETSDDTVATLQLLEGTSERVLQEAAVRVDGAPGTLASVNVPVLLTGDGLHRVRFRVRSAGHGAWALADIKVPVNYGFEVVDFTARLNAMATHASAFDAHPNEATHRVMAEEVYRVLTSSSTP